MVAAAVPTAPLVRLLAPIHEIAAEADPKMPTIGFELGTALGLLTLAAS